MPEVNVVNQLGDVIFNIDDALTFINSLSNSILCASDLI